MIDQKKENRHIYPEIIIGLTGGIGCDFDGVQQILEEEYQSSGYEIHLIKLSECLNKDEVLLFPKKNSLNNQQEGYFSLMCEKMKRCTTLREKCKFNGILALVAIAKIMMHRQKKLKETNSGRIYKTAFIIRSLKRTEEFNVLRKVYGRNFIMLSLYCSEENRLKHLEDEITRVPESSVEKKTTLPDTPLSLARRLIDNDRSDLTQQESGQELEDVFSLGHFFLNAGKNRAETQRQVRRFHHILIGNPFVTPTRDELNMYLAHGFSLKSADLNRQIGAVIYNDENGVLAIGCNEVPKFGGGYYWDDEPPEEDHRSFQIGYDSNEKIKSELIMELDNALKRSTKKGYKEILKENSIKKLKWENLIEYGRTIHAEEAAICEAARKGISLTGATLYTTTFPCHLCSALILAVGIKEVVFIEPYPKSKADEIFSNSISVEPLPHEKVSGTLCFRHFIGVAPRRYKQAFRYSNKDREEKHANCSYKTAKSFCLDENSVPRHLKGRTFLSYILKESILIKRYFIDDNENTNSVVKDDDKNKLNTILSWFFGKTNILNSKPSTFSDCFKQEAAKDNFDK
jgi:deoxycytidylate deaminase